MHPAIAQQQHTCRLYAATVVSEGMMGMNKMAGSRIVPFSNNCEVGCCVCVCVHVQPRVQPQQKSAYIGGKQPRCPRDHAGSTVSMPNPPQQYLAEQQHDKGNQLLAPRQHFQHVGHAVRGKGALAQVEIGTGDQGDVDQKVNLCLIVCEI